MRVVFDTNVLISAIGWAGSPFKAFTSCLDLEKHTIVTSEILLSELFKVLDYEKFRNSISDSQKYAILSSLAKVAHVVSPEEEITLISEDPQDNRVLECALAGDADFIISGDKHLLKLKTFGKIKILTAEEFLEMTK